MKIKYQLSVLATTLVIGFAPAVARADAIAQAILDVSNFTLRTGNGVAGTTSLPNSLLSVLTPTSTPTVTSDANAKLNGVTASTTTFGIQGNYACVGACGFYTPNTMVVGSPLATFAGASADQSGNAISDSTGANAQTDSIVSLKPNGDGSTSSNTNLNASFIINLAVASTIEIAFDANSYMRGMLTKNAFGTAATSWTFTIIDNLSGDEVFGWNPNGSVGGAGGVSGTVGGVEYADAFKMTDTRSAVLAGDNIIKTNNLGHFEAETGKIAVGSYRVSLRQTTAADAKLIPEPGSLALFGVAMFGAAAAARRRAKK